MAAGILELFKYFSLSVFCALVSASEDFKNAKVGDTVTLPCKVSSTTPALVIEWVKPDLGSEYVLFYRDGRPEPENQYAGFRGRVELKDSQVKNGDMSLVLKNVTSDDSGTYECHAVWTNTKRRKRASVGTEPINTITLIVEPGSTSGGAAKSRNSGAIAGVVVLALVVVAVVGVLIHRKRTAAQHQSSQSSADEEAGDAQLI